MASGTIQCHLGRFIVRECGTKVIIQMTLLLDIAIFLGILFTCWRGYQQRQSWICLISALLLRLASQKSFGIRFFVYAPVFVGWLLLCHWVDVKGWTATAAGLMVFAMTLGLEAMRQTEERQKIV